jgi:flagellar biosynthetic protein FliR
MIVLQNTLALETVSALLLFSIRLAGLFLVAPIFSATAVSLPIRIGLTFAIALALYGSVKIPPIDLMSLQGLAAIFTEAVIGIAMGLIYQLVFASAAMAGEQIAFSMGLGFASMVDPQTGSQSPVITQFLSVMLILLFFVLQAHHAILRQYAASYQALPIGGALEPGLFLGIAKAGGLIYSSALITALPIIVFLFLTNLLIGLMTRIAPQLNVFSVGFPVTILIGIVGLMLTFPAIGNGMGNLLKTASSIVNEVILNIGATP